MRLAVLMLGAVVALSSCGAAGAPEPPTTPKSGLNVSGEARIGVVAQL